VDASPGLNSSGQNDNLFRWGIAPTFFRATERGKWAEPWLATSYEYAEDYSYVDIHLRQDVQFHYGYGEFTAEDAVWNMNDHNAYTNPESIGQQAGDYAALFYAWEVIDKYTVRAPFQHFDPRWAAALLSQNAQGCNMFSKKACVDEHDYDWCRANIVGTGPIQTVEVRLHDRFVMEPVPYDHWDVNVQFDKLTVLEIPEETAQLAMIRTGEVDAAIFRVSHVPALVEDGFKTMEFGGYMLGIFWSGNLWESEHAITGEPLDTSAVRVKKYPWVADYNDKEEMEEARQVRWAVAEAIDREAINETVMGGLGLPIGRMHINPASPYYKEEWDIPYNLASAKEHLAKTSWPDGFPVPFYSASGIPEAVVMADALTVQLRDLAPRMDVTAPHMQYTVFRPSVVTRTAVMPWITWYDEALSDWPMDFPKLPTACSITRGGFALGWEDPLVAEMFLKNSAEKDKAKRIQNNIELLDYLHHWQIVTGIGMVPGLLVYNPKSIAEWPHPPDLRVGLHSLYNIVPVR